MEKGYRSMVKNNWSFASEVKNQEILLEEPIQHLHFLTLLKELSSPLIAH